MAGEAQDGAGAQHEVEAVVAVGFLQRRGGGFAEGGVRRERFLQPAVEGLGGELGALLVRGADDDEDEVREGRVIPLAAELDLLLPEAVEVVVPRELDAGLNGVKDCTKTSPSTSPRPARPATWVSSWKVRSPARKSGRCRPRSALMMPTSVTLGKCRPLAIICVPTRMSILPVRKAPSVSR